jgi:hypothetical protein
LGVLVRYLVGKCEVLRHGAAEANVPVCFVNSLM